MKELWGLRGHQFLHREPLEPALLLVEKSLPEWPVPQFINLFLPEFPIRPLSGHQQLKVGQWNPWKGSQSQGEIKKQSLNCPVLHFSVQILGLVAKGSFGTVLKVLDCGQKAVFAVKVGTKALPHSLVPASALIPERLGGINSIIPLLPSSITPLLL